MTHLIFLRNSDKSTRCSLKHMLYSIQPTTHKPPNHIKSQVMTPYMRIFPTSDTFADNSSALWQMCLFLVTLAELYNGLTRTCGKLSTRPARFMSRTR